MSEVFPIEASLDMTDGLDIDPEDLCSEDDEEEVSCTNVSNTVHCYLFLFQQQDVDMDSTLVESVGATSIDVLRYLSSCNTLYHNACITNMYYNHGQLQVVIDKGR